MSLAKSQNSRLIKHMYKGGIRTLLYGGNANLYNIAPSEYHSLLKMLVDVRSADTAVAREYGVTELARRQLADKLKIPFAYFERMRGEQPELLDERRLARRVICRRQEKVAERRDADEALEDDVDVVGAPNVVEPDRARQVVAAVDAARLALETDAAGERPRARRLLPELRLAVDGTGARRRCRGSPRSDGARAAASRAGCAPFPLSGPAGGDRKHLGLREKAHGAAPSDGAARRVPHGLPDGGDVS
jgi:hypothetical protein